MNAVDDTCRLMQAFLERTGIIADGGDSRRRYLWTDALAVQTSLGLARETGDQDWESAARSLIDQVHGVLGRHRDDDVRDGWISGLPDAEGTVRPTAGGLRIGKPLPERGSDDAEDASREWGQDGQYFHYLTKWMQALLSAFEATGEAAYAQYARDLAIASGRFIAADGARMYWKMSTDLTRPLVPGMGMHDPLDGLVCLTRIEQVKGNNPSLAKIRESLKSLCEARQWATTDPLGIGGLLLNTAHVAQLESAGVVVPGSVSASRLATDALTGLQAFQRAHDPYLPARYRLPFRELGLCLGINTVASESAGARVPGAEEFRKSVALVEAIESFWLLDSNQEASTWRDHLDINAVTLAASRLARTAPQSFF